MRLVSLQGYSPSARFDSVAWHHAVIQESLQPSGPWTEIHTFVLTPPDADPENPAARNFSVESALDAGWYVVSFRTENEADREDSLPVHNVLNYSPSMLQVGALLRARTKDTAGNEVGTFNDDTRPTYDQAAELVASAVGTLSLRIGDSIPSQLIEEAKRLVAIRAAMLIELGYYPEQVSKNNSPYAQYKDLWEEGFGDGTGKKPGTLVQAISAAAASNDVVVAANPGMAVFSFPIADNLGTRRM